MNFNSVESQSTSYEFNFGKTFGKFGKTFKSTNLLPLRLFRTFRECFRWNFFFLRILGFLCDFYRALLRFFGVFLKILYATPKHLYWTFTFTFFIISDWGLISVLVRRFFTDISSNSEQNGCKMSVVQKNLHDPVPLWSKRTVVYAATMTSIDSWI